MKHETRDPKNNPGIVLESLELENFLSFRKEKVSFLMDDGNVAPFTIITGPNGAGKSSIFQALKFVLSSNSKDGRYTKWEEFINHGEDYLRVRANFKSNKDGLFKIERLLRRGRSTQFFLNNDQVRSNKIQDFATKFGIKPDNPFSFIRQGHVTAIKDLSREQIYYLIETGIGIKNLRDEITARSRELESLEQEIKSLAIQEKTCERNDQILKEKMLLLKEKRDLEHQLTKANAEKKWAQRINIINKITSIETKIDELKNNIESILEERNKIEQKNKEIKKNIRENEEARREQEIEIRLKRKEMKSIRAVIAGWNDEKRELFEKNEAMKVRKEELTLKLQELEQLMEKLLEEIKTKNTKMEELSVQKKKVIKERDSIHERLLENREWLQRHEKLRYRVESIEKDIANNDKMLDKIERETNSLMKQHEELGNEIGSFDWYFDPKLGPNPKNHLDARIKKINSIIKDLQVRLQVKQREEIKLKQKLGATIGYKGDQGMIPGAISRLRKELDSRDLEDKIKGPIMDYLQYDIKHARAIDAVFKKNALLGFVAFTKEDFSLLNSLRNKLKAPSFIYLPKQEMINPGERSTPDYPGVIDYLYKLIQVPFWLEPVMHDIVRDNILVETFSAAVSLVKTDDRAKCVTLDGVLVDSGRHTIKSAPKYHGPCLLKGATDDGTDSLEFNLTYLVKLNKDLEEKIAKLQKKRRNLEYKFQVCDRVRILSMQKKRVSKKMDELLEEKDFIKQHTIDLRKEISKTRKEIQLHESKKPQEFLELTRKARELDASIDRINDSIASAKDEKHVLHSTMKDHDNAINDLKKQLDAMQENHEKLMERVSQLKDDFEKAEEKIEDCTNTIEEGLKTIHQLEESTNQLVLSKEAGDEELSRIQIKEKINLMEMESLHKEVKSLEAEQSYIETRLKDEKEPEELLLVEEYDSIIHELNEKLASRRFFSISEEIEIEYERNQGLLEKIGSKIDEINDEITSIVDICNDLKSNYLKKMVASVDDLQARINAKFDLLGVPFMVELNIEGAFENPKFNIHVDFFDDIAMPITALSGGQKTIVALALMLTLQDLNPGPISVFDEAHIFLDDSNKEMISRLVKKTTEKVQLIMLVPTTSHNFITFADKIIGVARQGTRITNSMEQGGNSTEKVHLGYSQVVEYT